MLRQTLHPHIKSCNSSSLPEPAGKTSDQVATRAFELWLARAFRNGSPQEDWLRAQREIIGAAR
jgi:hypothetical protein